MASCTGSSASCLRRSRHRISNISTRSEHGRDTSIVETVRALARAGPCSDVRVRVHRPSQGRHISVSGVIRPERASARPGATVRAAQRTPGANRAAAGTGRETLEGESAASVRGCRRGAHDRLRQLCATAARETAGPAAGMGDTTCTRRVRGPNRLAGDPRSGDRRCGRRCRGAGLHGGCRPPHTDRDGRGHTAIGSRGCQRSRSAVRARDVVVGGARLGAQPRDPIIENGHEQRSQGERRWTHPHWWISGVPVADG